MKNEKTNPQFIVWFLNSVLNNSTLGYGTLLSGGRMTLQDANGNSPFAQLPGGSVVYNKIAPPNSSSNSGSVYTFSKAVSAGSITVYEPSSTLVANTIYSFQISQINPYNGETLIKTVTYNTGASGPIATGSATAEWVKQLTAASGFNVTCTTSGGGQILTIAASPKYPVISVAAATNVTFNGSSSTTPVSSGTYSVGYSNTTTNTTYGDDMNWANPTGAAFSSYSGYVSSNIYDKCVLSYTDEGGQQFVFYIFINIGDANYGTSTTKFVYQFLQISLTLGGQSPSSTTVQSGASISNPNIF